MVVALNVPTTGQWITFPVIQKKSIPIKWSEDSIPRSATYYVSKCYWGYIVDKSAGKNTGNPPDSNFKEREDYGEIKIETDEDKDKEKEKEPPKDEPRVPSIYDHPHPIPVVLDRVISNPQDWKIKIIGETTLYIASEFIEPETAKGPLEDYHIKSLAGFKDDKEGPFWTTMQLNDCFHYGQNQCSTGADKWFRWIVYHPAIAPGIDSPQIFQHRFTGSMSSDVVATAVTGASDSTTGFAQQGAKALKAVTIAGMEILKGVSGNYLRRFLDREGRIRAGGLLLKLRELGVKRQEGPINDPNKMTQEEQRKLRAEDEKRARHIFLNKSGALEIAVMQTVETIRSHSEQKEAEAKAVARAGIAKYCIDDIKEMLEHKTGFWNYLLQFGKNLDPVSERQLFLTMLEYNKERVDLTEEWYQGLKHNIQQLTAESSAVKDELTKELDKTPPPPPPSDEQIVEPETGVGKKPRKGSGKKIVVGALPRGEPVTAPNQSEQGLRSTTPKRPEGEREWSLPPIRRPFQYTNSKNLLVNNIHFPPEDGPKQSSLLSPKVGQKQNLVFPQNDQVKKPRRGRGAAIT